MSKKKIAMIVAVALVVVGIISGIVGYIILTKPSITTEKFSKDMKSMDFKDEYAFVINDGTHKLDSKSTVKQSVVAERGTKYRVYFTKMKSEKAAEIAFAENRNDFEIFETKEYVPVYERGLNYHSYKLETNDKYYVVSQIKDTFVYVVAFKNYRSEIDKVVKKLNY